MFKFFISLMIGFCLAACGSGSGETLSSNDGVTTTGSSTQNPTSTESYVGTWKGTIYGGNGTFSDIILILNTDGSYSCSGYPPPTGDASTDQWTPWRTICGTPAGQTNKWELILHAIRFTHNLFLNDPMTLAEIVSFDWSTLVLKLPPSKLQGLSKNAALFTKQP